MPPMTGQNLDFLTKHLGNQQSCFPENCVRHILYETLARIYNKAHTDRTGLRQVS